MTTAQDREHLSVLGAGLFTNGVWDMLSVIVPLYAVAVGLNAAEIGLVVAARSVLPAVLSIHGGILMDELGTRRVLRWVAMVSAVLPLLFPLSGWFALLLALQLLLGLASGLGMAASQTWSMQTSGGMTSLLARYSIATRIGTFIGPVIVGAAWDLFGAWVAFVCVALCGAGTIAATAYSSGVRPRPNPPKPSAAVLIPRWAPHKRALLLAIIPGVTFILAASFLRNAVVRLASIITPALMGGIAETWGIEASFYVIGAIFLAGTALLAVAAQRIGQSRS